MTPISNPLVLFDVKDPEEIKRQIKVAKDIADFFRNHWLWFYIAAGLAFYRGITATRVNAAIFRIDRALSKNTKQNPRKKK